MGTDNLTDTVSNGEDNATGEDARSDARAIDEGAPTREIVSDDPDTPPGTTD